MKVSTYCTILLGLAVSVSASAATCPSDPVVACDTGYLTVTYAETQSDGDIVFRLNGATATNGDPVDGYAYCDNSNSLKCWPLLLTALVSQREVKAFFNQTKGGSGTEKDPWIVTALRIH